MDGGDGIFWGGQQTVKPGIDAGLSVPSKASSQSEETTSLKSVISTAINLIRKELKPKDEPAFSAPATRVEERYYNEAVFQDDTEYFVAEQAREKNRGPSKSEMIGMPKKGGSAHSQQRSDAEAICNSVPR